jgi:hypothetical protein
MFSRTPKSKNRAHGSNQKRHRPYGTPYAHTHTEKEGDAISMGSQMAIRTPAAAVGGSPRTIKTTRKLNVLNEEYQSAHLFNVGDLLIVRESEITLHQDISTGFNRGIATPFPVPTGAGAVRAHLLRSEHGSHVEVAACRTDGSFSYVILDSDGRQTTQQCQLPVDGSAVTCISQAWTGVSLVGTSDARIFSVNSSPTGLRWKQLKVEQSGLWGLVSRLGILTSSTSTKASASGSAMKHTVHGGRPCPQWSNDSPQEDILVALLPVGYGSVLAIGNRAQLWGGCSSGDGQVSQLWECEVHRTLFNAANDRDPGDPGGFQGQKEISIVHALLQSRTEQHGISGTLFVLALSRPVDGDDDSDDDNDELWLLSVDVPFDGGDVGSPECRFFVRGVDLNASQEKYVPSLHLTGDGDVLISYISASKGTLQTMSTHPMIHTPTDSGLQISHIVTSGSPSPEGGLDVLKTDDSLVTVSNGSFQKRAVPVSNFHGENMTFAWNKMHPGSPVSAPTAGTHPTDNAENVQNALLEVCVSNSTEKAEGLHNVHGLITGLDTSIIEKAFISTSNFTLNRMPTGQHWGGRGTGEAQLALLLLNEKRKSHSRLVHLLKELNIIQHHTSLQVKLQEAHNRIVVASNICEYLVSNSEGNSPSKDATISPLESRRRRAPSNDSSMTQSHTGHTSSHHSIEKRALTRAKISLRSGMKNTVQATGRGNYESRGLSLMDEFFSNVTHIDEAISKAVLDVLHNQERSRDDELVLPLGVLFILHGGLTKSECDETAPASTLLASIQMRRTIIRVLKALYEDSLKVDPSILSQCKDTQSMVTPLREICESFLNFYDEQRASEGLIDEEEYNEALGMVRNALITLASPQLAFDQAERSSDSEGLVSAVLADNSLHPALVNLCESKGALYCTQGKQLATLLFEHCIVDPSRIRPGLVHLLFELGVAQPQQWNDFLKKCPQLRWLHALVRTPPSHSEAVESAMELMSGNSAIQRNAADARTLASFARLSAVLGDATPATISKIDIEQTFRVVQHRLTQITNNSSVQRALTPEELVTCSLKFVSEQVDGEVEQDLDPTSVLFALKETLGLCLKVIDCHLRSGFGGIWEGKRDHVWVMALRCQEDLWGQIASQHQLGTLLHGEQESDVRATVFVQLLITLKDTNDVLSAADATQQARWARLQPRMDVLKQQCDLEGGVLDLVQCAANI